MKTLNDLNWHNGFAQLGDDFYAKQNPTPVSNPYLISVSPAAADLIDLDLASTTSSDFIETVSGNRIPPEAQPLAQIYAGHQFGHFVPQLGDGRAILLGDVEGKHGRWELQLKGAGPTPFSRNADGRAVLRSSIREYLCSEAMAALGIATTRALAITGTPDEVYREQIESGSTVMRMAPTFIRFGTFELFYYRGQYDQVQQLADYLIEQHYPELQQEDEPYLALLKVVSQRSAKMIAQWQLVGFAHGVMNSDNMSVLGLTIDYGPFGFLDQYDPHFICNHSDHSGRYAFDQQPQIGLWNVSCFAQTLLPLLDEDPETAAEKAQKVLQQHQGHHLTFYHQGLRQKLGLQTEQKEDIELAQALLGLMQLQGADYTLVFRHLSQIKVADKSGDEGWLTQFKEAEKLQPWLESYRARLHAEESKDDERQQQMNKINPKYILRNYLAQNAIAKAEQKDFSEVENLLKLLQQPFDEQPEMEAYAAKPPEWAAEISVSCSS
ncbi:MAG: YdiU family protein [Gammaproteobacteria bacterium]|nr:YdiU family protein [Gammaproteobacteria bacterium]